MKVEQTYPELKKRRFIRGDLIKILRLPFLAAGWVCAIINIANGGKAWSLVVLWSLWIVWTMLFSPDMVEYNRISQSISGTVRIIILLWLIDLLLAPGWAVTVLPIVCFGGLTLTGVLFFSDLTRQKQNVMPMVILTALSFISGVIGLIIQRDTTNWQFVTLVAVALTLFIAAAIFLRGTLIRALVKHFHIK